MTKLITLTEKIRDETCCYDCTLCEKTFQLGDEVLFTDTGIYCSEGCETVQLARNTVRAKQAMIRMIRTHGACGTLNALAAALKDLGAEWRGDDGPAARVLAVEHDMRTFRPDDWRSAARCGVCAACQVLQHVPPLLPAPECTGRGTREKPRGMSC